MGSWAQVARVDPRGGPLYWCNMYMYVYIYYYPSRVEICDCRIPLSAVWP